MVCSVAFVFLSSCVFLGFFFLVNPAKGVQNNTCRLGQLTIRNCFCGNISSISVNGCLSPLASNSTLTIFGGFKAEPHLLSVTKLSGCSLSLSLSFLWGFFVINVVRWSWKWAPPPPPPTPLIASHLPPFTLPFSVTFFFFCVAMASPLSPKSYHVQRSVTAHTEALVRQTLRHPWWVTFINCFAAAIFRSHRILFGFLLKWDTHRDNKAKCEHFRVSKGRIIKCL